MPALVLILLFSFCANLSTSFLIKIISDEISEQARYRSERLLTSTGAGGCPAHEKINSIKGRYFIS
jgi:hypothetical protein